MWGYIAVSAWWNCLWKLSIYLRWLIKPSEAVHHANNTRITHTHRHECITAHIQAIKTSNRHWSVSSFTIINHQIQLRIRKIFCLLFSVIRDNQKIPYYLILFTIIPYHLLTLFPIDTTDLVKLIYTEKYAQHCINLLMI